MSHFMYECDALVENRIVATEKNSTVLEDTIIGRTPLQLVGHSSPCLSRCVETTIQPVSLSRIAIIHLRTP